MGTQGLQPGPNLHMNRSLYIVDFFGSRHIRHGVVALLTVCAGLITWSMLPHKAKSAAVLAQAVTLPSHPNIGSTADKIATAHLFGQGAAEGIAAGPAVASASITVQGLFYSPDQDMAWAILDADGKSGIFKAGDTLPDGERLAAVGMNAIQIGNGPMQRVVEMAQTFGPASGIRLDGLPDLYARQDSFPGQSTLSTAAPVVQRLRTVSLPQTNDPIAQMRALREQLITH